MARRLKQVPASLWVVLLTLPALAPLARQGFFESHDGLIHAYRLAALDEAVRAGVLYPRWFSGFAFDYGHPVLNFYGPLSYYFGLPFTLSGMDAATALKLVAAGGLVASALGMYLFARRHLERGPAVAAAVVYATLPYHLVDVYVRGALAEHLAFAWFPLVLWAFHALVCGPPGQRPARMCLGALLLAALILTHNLSALLFAPVLAAYVGCLLVAKGSHPGLKQTGPALVGALALAAAAACCYWLPVLAESRFVGLGLGASAGYRDHLVTWSELVSLSAAYPYPADPGVAPTFPLGVVQLAILVGSVALLAFPSPSRRWPEALFLLVAAGSALMLTEASLPVWRLFEPILAFLQYPWRFQAITALASAFLAGALVQGLGRPRWGRSLVPGALVIVATALWALWRLPFTPSAADLRQEAMWERDRQFGQVGATWTGEYLPIWVKEQRWALSLPTTERPPSETAVPAGQMELTATAYSGLVMTVESAQPVHLVLHQFFYPGWEARWQGEVYAAHPEGDLGLAAFDLPAGSGPLVVRLGLTWAQRWGGSVSVAGLVAIAAVLVLPIVPMRQGAERRAAAAHRVGPHFGVAGCSLLLAGGLVVGILWPNGRQQPVEPVGANLADRVELLACRIAHTEYRPGDGVAVTLYWRSLRSLDGDTKAFVHLTDAALSRQPAQHDGDPGGGFTPVSRWLPGEVLADKHLISLPGDLAPGRYLVWAGMYAFESVQNLEVIRSEAPSQDNRVLIGEIEVLEP